MAKRRSGRSGSKKPVRKTVPVWVKLKPTEIEKLIIKLAKEGKGPSIIGILLRDQYGVPDVKRICKKSILQILKDNKLTPDIPEDLYFLMKKAVIIRRHLERNRRDKFSIKGLILTESKIRKLARYYRRKKTLPETWKYDAEKAKLLVKV